MAIASEKLLDAVTVTGAGGARAPRRGERTFQATGQTTAGAGAVDARIEASNDETNWTEIGAITLVLSTVVANDGFSSAASWRFIRARVASISGTGAAVTVWMGV